MAYDLVFGKIPRDWSCGLDLRPRAPEPTSESVLDQLIATPSPKRPSTSVEKQVKTALREKVPGVLETYEKYQPRYSDHKVSVKIKTDLLGDD